MGRTCGIGILPWNGHLGGTGILVELASCQFPPYFRAGRMPTLLLFIQRLTQRRIYRHLGLTRVRLSKNPFAIYRFSLSYEVQSSLMLIPCFDAAHPYSLFPIPYSLKSRNFVPHSYENCYICL
ncbi:MAG: hypothetical protein F6K56_30730 [Moorea sp. SIO3G5]|nr:hypothetical protein [Moorena sp. SIO3G5]